MADTFSLSKQALPFIAWNFPTRTIGEDDDEICRLCFGWTSENSSCAHRYEAIQGEWKSTIPLEKGHDNPTRFACVPICDKCFDKCNLDNKKSIEIMGHAFNIDCHFRMNV
jgi:hypothetical protein